MKATQVLICFFFLVGAMGYGEDDVMNQTQTNPKKGILEGTVTIGPMHPGPVRIDEPEQKVDPAIFAPLRIVIYKADGKEKLQEVKIDGKGYYKVELDAGKYLVDLPHKYGIRPGARAKQEVTIESGKTTKLDLDIDTGIR